MAQYRTRNRLLLAGIESVSGTEESLTVGSHAVLAENPQPSPNFEVLQTAEAGASLDDRGPIVGGGNFAFSGKAYLKGSGAGATPPEIDPILRAAALAVTNLASAATGTAQAGAASAITLAVGASGTDDLYVGMPITLTGGTGSGQTRVITDYDGTGKVATVTPAWTTPPDATSTYSIPACNVYKPSSASLETLTAYLYDNAAAAGVDSLLRKIVGAAADGTITLTTRGLGELAFTLTGILPALPANVTAPSAPTFQTARPRPFINADAYLDNVAVKFRQLTLGLGNTVQQADDPAALYGYDVAGVTERRITGQINPNLELLSSRNAFSDFVNGTTRKLWLRWGSASGNSLSILVPEATYTGANPADTDGFNAEELPFQAAGFDSGHYLCFY